MDSRDRKHHSHKKSKKRHRSRSPDSPYQSYPAPAEKLKKVNEYRQQQYVCIAVCNLRRFYWKKSCGITYGNG